LEIIITANSPGEVAGWVQPAVKSLKKHYPRAEISVFLTPCVFASGSEKKVLSQIPGVDRVFSSKQYLKYVFFAKKPPHFNPEKTGIVLFLGGDLFHAFLLGKKLKYPVIAYTEGVYNWGKHIEKFMVPNQKVKSKLLKKGAPPAKIELIGNLMLDSIETVMTPSKTRKYLNINQETVISLFPGSRPHEVEYMLPFLMKSLLRFALNNNDQKYKYYLALSPFVSREKISKIFHRYLQETRTKGQFINKKDFSIINISDINISGNIEIKVFSNFQYELMQITDLALTIPGTNNLQLAYFGTPMIVILPLNKPELIPLEGLLGLIGQIPVLGSLLKKIFIPKIAANKEFVALPNIIREREIVPELRGVLKPEDLEQKMIKLLSDEKRLKDVKQELKNEFQSVSASSKITEIVGQVLALNP
jgi:lipid-A-disaccharide synthase